MKKINYTLLLLATVLLLHSCKKDENGYRIKYHKDKIGIGHVFWKFDNDSIAPINKVKVSITASGYGGGPGELFTYMLSHTDDVMTNINGTYSFKFIKEIDDVKKIDSYDFQVDIESLPIVVDSNYYFVVGYASYKGDIVNTSENTVIIDTIFLYPKYSNKKF